MKRIGFIGLGNMGAPMAANLVKAGYEVTGFDLAPFEARGVKSAADIGEAVKGQEAVITMLPAGEHVLSVYKDILSLAGKGTLFIDCSTIDVDSAREAHALAGKAGQRSVDAPVSGGVVGAEAGTLTFMAGGADDAFADARPLFEVMGQKAVHCGAAGAGQSAKICNNMILAISMIGVCEAIGLADTLKLDRQALFDVVSTSSGYCWSMNAYCPMPGVGPESPADRGYKPGFSAPLMLKDLGLAMTAARSSGANTPLGSHAEQLYAEFVTHGGEKMDFSGILKAIAPKSFSGG